MTDAERREALREGFVKGYIERERRGGWQDVPSAAVSLGQQLAVKEFPDPPKRREVEWEGTIYRVNDSGDIEYIASHHRSTVSWYTAGYIRFLYDLLEHPDEPTP